MDPVLSFGRPRAGAHDDYERPDPQRTGPREILGDRFGVAELRPKGVEVADEVDDQTYGRGTSIEVPGDGTMQLSQPRHAPEYELDG